MQCYNRASAYSQLAAQLCADVESIAFEDDRTRLHTTILEHQQKREEADKMYVALTKEVSVQKQIISDLGTTIADLQAANSVLSRSQTAVQRELEMAARNQSQTSQFCVELRMQGLDFKAEVDRRANKMLGSIQARLGFIPVCIQKHAAQLRVLKVCHKKECFASSMYM